MKTIVTGCAGFIGSAIASRLLDEGHEVIGIDEMNDAYDPRLKEHRLARLNGRTGFTFNRLDIADRASMNRIIGEGEPDRVYHLAARAGVRQSCEEPWLYTHTNIDGTLSMLEACRTHDVDRFLMASTSSLYGANEKTPFHEDDDTSRPLSPYAATKKGAEALCASYTHLYGIHTIVPRYFTVYGPAGRPDMSVYRFVERIMNNEQIVIYGNGEQIRDFTFIDDIARGTMMAMDCLDGHTIINLGNDAPVSVNSLVRLIERVLSKTAKVIHKPAHDADVQATWASIDKGKGIGWAPKTTFETGIRATIAWHADVSHSQRTPNESRVL